MGSRIYRHTGKIPLGGVVKVYLDAMGLRGNFDDRHATASRFGYACWAGDGRS